MSKQDQTDTILESRHNSTWGMYGGCFFADMDGFVHFDESAVLSGTWDAAGDGMDDEQALAVAEHNVETLIEVGAALAEWRDSDS